MMDTTQLVDPAALGLAIRPDLIEGVTLIRQLGAGATSTVFQGIDSADPKKSYAIKVLTQYLVTQEDARRRWDREAELLLQLDHPNIVKAIRTGVAEGRPYLMMEYLQGETLNDRLRRMGKLPEEEIFAIAGATLAALQLAGSRRIIHRDIKPANMIRLADGTVKLMDFGLAKLAEDKSLTMTGAIVGTPLYVSPEQARCDTEITPQSDLYSLGVTLFHLACGTPPFSELNTSLLLTRKITDDVPDIRLVDPAISGALAFFIHKLTGRFCENRPKDATAAAELLDQLRRGVLTTTHFAVETRTSRARGRPATAAEMPAELYSQVVETITHDDQLQSKPQFLQAGEVLFYEDDISEDCYILLSGAVEVLKSGRKVATIDEPGAFIGEMGPLRQAPRSATVVARESTVLLTILKADFNNFFTRHPEMMMTMALSLAQRLHSTTMELHEKQAQMARLSKMVNEMKAVLSGKI